MTGVKDPNAGTRQECDEYMTGARTRARARQEQDEDMTGEKRSRVEVGK